MVQKVKRNKTPQEALTSLMRLCARSERSSGDALRLMRGWGVSDADAREVLSRLTKERFIDDSRYAEAFVRDKIRLSGWGERKISAALRAKAIAPQIIDEAIRQEAQTDMHERLATLLARRVRTLKYRSVGDARQKLLRYALSAGYDFSTAIDCVEQCTKCLAADKDDDEQQLF